MEITDAMQGACHTMDGSTLRSRANNKTPILHVSWHKKQSQKGIHSVLAFQKPVMCCKHTIAFTGIPLV